MKRLIVPVLVLFLAVLIITVTDLHGKEIDFSGSWSFDGLTDIDVGEPAQCTFTLKLKQYGNKLSGDYIAVALDGRRIDFDEDGGNKIIGVINGNTADVQFESGSWGGKGRAKITHMGNRLMWEIAETTKPDFWCPKKVILVKKG